jgi:hypothetical protein
MAALPPSLNQPCRGQRFSGKAFSGTRSGLGATHEVKGRNLGLLTKLPQSGMDHSLTHTKWYVLISGWSQRWSAWHLYLEWTAYPVLSLVER